MKFYIAAPFFNERQIKIVEEIKYQLKINELTYFSPKDDCLFENDKGMDSQKIFDTNCLQIRKCDGIIVVTDSTDAGTIFEAGYAFGIEKANTIYVWVDYIEDANFNLMLAHAADITVKGMKELSRILKKTKENGSVPCLAFSGRLE